MSGVTFVLSLDAKQFHSDDGFFYPRCSGKVNCRFDLHQSLPKQELLGPEVLPFYVFCYQTQREGIESDENQDSSHLYELFH